MKHLRYWSVIKNQVLSRHPRVRTPTAMSLLALALMVCAAGVMLLLAHASGMPLAPVQWWAAISVGGLVLTTALVRSGRTIHRKDPALTLWQMAWIATSCATVYALAGDAKGVVPSVLSLTLFCGALSLSVRQVAAVGLYALAVFVVAMALQPEAGKGLWSVHHLAYLLILTTVVLGCIAMSMRVQQIRNRFVRQRHELALALQQNRDLASRDPLTGLINRRTMRELMLVEQHRCNRGGRSMLLAQLDIDYFKDINDTYGHGAGDAALQMFAQTVQQSVRSSDVLARWGGEEFVLMLCDAQLSGVLQMLERVRTAVENMPVRGTPEALRITVSIGVAEHRPSDAVELTLERADRALYEAKRTGRNRVVVAPGPDSLPEFVPPDDCREHA